jgi:protein-L-isoaspartate(D-aspartate) O-methyltransferase
VLGDPAWRAAFCGVPRQVFVPEYYADTDDGTFAAAADLEVIYSDEPLVTQLDPYGVPASSSTMPSLMAAMLDGLEVTGGERVLEIGTGTGYNAALLCHRLGDANVISVDIAADLVEHARARLARLGYRPTLAAGDGADGHPAAAPFDRIIATCAWPRVPAAWLGQVRDGGLILVNLFRGLYGGGLAVLRMQGGQATGGFLPRYGGFMPSRTAPGPGRLPHPDLAEGTRRPTVLGHQALDDDGFALVAALTVDVVRIPRWSADRAEQLWLHAPDGSWACLREDDVVQGGPVKLWDVIEDTDRRWRAAACPPVTLTVTSGGDHLARYGDACWTIPG